MRQCVTLLALALSFPAHALVPPPAYVRYLIVGAGPGGLQVAHYMESAGRDYLVLESAERPASFFASYPRFRQLISINKREVGRDDSLDFAFRHDWNSLLSDASHSASSGSFASTTDARLTPTSLAPALRFTNYSTRYYPHADDLVLYAQVWAGSTNASARGLGRASPLRVRYNTNVVSIARTSEWAPGADAQRAAIARGAPRFVITTARGEVFTCTFLIIATGLQEAVSLPSGNGTAAVAAGLVHTYASAPADADAYRGQRVLVIGHGNAAWEFAHYILGATALVHVAGRTTSRIKLALETHYPGNVRAVHATLLETYNLKSLDGITSVPFDRLTFARAPDGRIAVGVAGSVGCTRDAFGRATSRCSFREPYDAVIACLGWRFSSSLFDDAVRPALAHNGKYPNASATFQSVNVEGLYFAGTVAHAGDYKKTSGGFIHGFRYTARALHRFLEEEEADAVVSAAPAEVAVGIQSVADGVWPLPRVLLAGAPPARWPSTPTSTLRALVELILRRANDAAGIYQMFGTLSDVFVFDGMVSPQRADASVRAALDLPWSFFDAGAEAKAAAGTDPTGLARAIADRQSRAPPSTAPASASKRAAEAAIDSALAGSLFEELPVGAAPAFARAACARAAAEPCVWLQLTLEFGASLPAGQHDPFALDRADVNLAHANASHFLHPVVRAFRSGAHGTGRVTSIATLHLVEDFAVEWRLHSAHVLPLARYLQELGRKRNDDDEDDDDDDDAGSSWLPMPAPPSFLSGILTQLASSCDDASLHFLGEAVPIGGAVESDWFNRLSVAAERKLGSLQALAVAAFDAFPDVRVSAEEDAHTQSVRARWAAARVSDTNAAAAPLPLPDELPRPPPPPPSSSSRARRTAAAAAYDALTATLPEVALLLVDARSGRCAVLVERLGLGRRGDVRVFGPSAHEKHKGTAVDVPWRTKDAPFEPREVVAHIRAIVGKAKASK